MCTVTLIPTRDNSFILTSNRDEAINRKTLTPEFYLIDKTSMLFPKDALAGGTWIGMSDKDTMICLLNGGFENHKRLPSYKISRGVVVKDLLAAGNLERAMKTYDCEGIEPFTIVAVSWQEKLSFFEMVWDGESSHIRKLKKEKHIWSSSTLYTPEMKKMRKDWFNDFKGENKMTPNDILDFHKNAGIGDDNVDLKIDRGVLRTCSITQIVKTDIEVSMRYEDLQSNEVNTIIFEAITA